jgi:16S rRNA (guanine966-N2)-methyltransferase
MPVAKGLPVRPTTDRARESIFNILDVNYGIEGKDVLDLFSGTGAMAFEFASRSAELVTAVDLDQRCIKHLKATVDKFKFDSVEVVRSDVFRFLKQVPVGYDIIFADPPYDLGNIDLIKELVFSNGWLKKDGILIVEHHARTVLPKGEEFLEDRIYGQSVFTFYKNK